MGRTVSGRRKTRCNSIGVPPVLYRRLLRLKKRAAKEIGLPRLTWEAYLTIVATDGERPR